MITPSRLQAAQTAFNAALLKGIAAPSRPVPDYAATIPSSSSSEKFPIGLVTTAMRVWNGERVIDELKFADIEVVNNDYQNAVRVSRNDLEDDKLNGYAIQFEQLGVQASNLWADLAGEALLNPSKWADKKDFFSADRKLEKSTICNLISGKLTPDNFLKARALIMAYMMPDNKGKMRLMPDTLIVGPSQEMIAKRIVEATLVSENGAAVDNLTRGLAKVVVDLSIPDDRWFVACCSMPIKPVIVMKRSEGSLVALDQPKDAPAFLSNVNLYGIHYRGAATLTIPHYIVMGDGE